MPPARVPAHGEDTIAAILLAAGASTRMGEPKALLRLRGSSLLEHVLTAVRRAHVDDVIVVLGSDAERIRRAVSMEDSTVVINPDYAEGMSTSIRAGVEAARPGTGAFLIVLADQPFVRPETMDALRKARLKSKARILLPTYRGVRGNPVLVDHSLASDLVSLEGDRGCRALFPEHREEMAEVAVDDPGVLLDLDTREDFDRMAEALERGETLEELAASAVSIHGRAPRRSGVLRPRVDVPALAQELRGRGEAFALATVVRVERPTSGKPGFKALVRPTGEILGWIGGSCAESALVEEARAALVDGRPRLLRLTPRLGAAPPEDDVVEHFMECHSGGTMDVFIEPDLPRPILLVVGDSPAAHALCGFGRILDYRVVLVAPGAGRDDFPEADEVVSELDRLAQYATATAYAAVATMGKYDGMALRTLAESPVPYIGVIASRRRAESLLAGLRASRLPQESLARIRSPAGLDLSAKTPEEIALSIVAEITQLRGTVAPKGPVAPIQATSPQPVDVVCGMTVDPATPLRTEHAGATYYFCSEGCLERFTQDPQAFLSRSG